MSVATSIDIGAENRERIRRMVVKAGVEGLRISTIMAKTGLSNTCVGIHLRALHVARKIEPSATTGPHVRWGRVGIRAVHEARRSREAVRRSERREAWARSAASPSFEHWLAHPVRVFVPANEAPPLPRRGPCSVWELAA
jgi:hypothetical protein